MPLPEAVVQQLCTEQLSWAIAPSSRSCEAHILLISVLTAQPVCCLAFRASMGWACRLSAGADPSQQDADAETALHKAAKQVTP